jgi:hypothetical protein
MRSSQRWLVGWLGAALLVAAAAIARADLVVHEWGTFTTRHDLAGEPYVWAPLVEVSDLPTFVYEAKSRATRKNTFPGTVRMETPVLYFYGDTQKVSVDVRFPSGIISEWYPHARWSRGGIRWRRVTMLPPSQTAALLQEPAPSHYYPARETDSVILRCSAKRAAQHEKFLFYRGVGTFETPVRVRLDGEDVHVGIVGPDVLERVLLFERRGDSVGFSPIDVTGNQLIVDRPVPAAGAIAGLESELRALLVGEGLYEREAQAMLDTWRDTWSEEGLRVLYIVPRRLTDDVLPLALKPEPSSLVRVLVGRAEFKPPVD